jgi:ARG/rhodanese/phosphatase superfamily protein
MSTLPEVRVGDPIRHESLAVFPLFSTVDARVLYLLSDEAIQAGSVAVEEVNEGGSVPNLLVTNSGDSRVLFLEGEELRGAKQNRVLNTSVLVAAHSKTSIPVSCVEAGRWRYRSKQFVSSDSHSSSKLRHILKKSSYASMKAGHGYTSDQGEVWKEVSRQMDSLNSSSPTAAMSDTFETNRVRLDEFRDRLKYVEGATGVAVAVGKKVVAVDLFDKPATCGRVWDRLLSGVVMDALEETQTDLLANQADVERLLASLGASAWEQAPAVGEGREFRLDPDPATHASALMFEDSMLHGSVVVAS